MDTRDLDVHVEKVLNTQSVSRAQEIMQSRSGIWIVAAISFVESALPIPILTDPFLMAAILLNRTKTKTIIFVTTTASVLGGMVAYLSAALFLEAILNMLTSESVASFEAVTQNYQDSSFLLAILGAITPLPYTTAAWGVAVLGGGLLSFTIASIIGRGFRYIVVGYAVYWFGPTVVRYAKRSMFITSVILVVAVAAYIFYKM